MTVFMTEEKDGSLLPREPHPEKVCVWVDLQNWLYNISFTQEEGARSLWTEEHRSNPSYVI